MRILAHRGNTEKGGYFENTIDAFKKACEAGFGIECDIYISPDDRICIYHENGLRGLNPDSTNEQFPSLKQTQTRLSYKYAQKTICKVADVLEVLCAHPDSFGAIHVKSKFQRKDTLDKIIYEIQKYPQLYNRILLFDLSVESAAYIKKKYHVVNLGCSVAHSFDIQRFNVLTGHTLYSIQQALGYRDTYNWAWMDEWDLKAKNGTKKLNTPKNIHLLRSCGYHIAFVGPELHRKKINNDLFHEDSVNKQTLNIRYNTLISCCPDIICTDIPYTIRMLYEKYSSDR